MDPEDELNLVLGIGPPRPKLPVTLQCAKYTSVRRLGRGAFGEVVLIFNTASKQYFVMKHIRTSGLSRNEKRSIHNEIAVLQHLHHPNIVSYWEHFEEKGNVYIVMAYAEVGDLFNLIRQKRRLKLKEETARSGGGSPLAAQAPLGTSPLKAGADPICELSSSSWLRSSLHSRVLPSEDGENSLPGKNAGSMAVFPEAVIFRMLIQMLLALKHLHDRRLLHRDIKSKNIFLMRTESSPRRQRWDLLPAHIAASLRRQERSRASTSMRRGSTDTSFTNRDESTTELLDGLPSQFSTPRRASHVSSCHTSPSRRTGQKGDEDEIDDGTEYLVQIGDFGISTLLRSSTMMAKTVCGTPSYFSPEICKGTTYNAKSDIWSLGIVLYEMCTGGIMPFRSEAKDNSKKEAAPLRSPGKAGSAETDKSDWSGGLMHAITTEEPPRIPEVYSEELWFIVRWMLDKDPNNRPDATQVLWHPLIIAHVPGLLDVLSTAMHSPSTAPPLLEGTRDSKEETAGLLSSFNTLERSGAIKSPAPSQLLSESTTRTHVSPPQHGSRRRRKYYLTDEGVFLQELPEDEEDHALSMASEPAGGGESVSATTEGEMDSQYPISVAQTPAYVALRDKAVHFQVMTGNTKPQFSSKALAALGIPSGDSQSSRGSSVASSPKSSPRRHLNPDAEDPQDLREERSEAPPNEIAHVLLEKEAEVDQKEKTPRHEPAPLEVDSSPMTPVDRCPNNEISVLARVEEVDPSAVHSEQESSTPSQTGMEVPVNDQPEEALANTTVADPVELSPSPQVDPLGEGDRPQALLEAEESTAERSVTEEAVTNESTERVEEIQSPHPQSHTDKPDEDAEQEIVDEPAQDGMPSDHDGHAESDVEDESPQDREETLDRADREPEEVQEELPNEPDDHSVHAEPDAVDEIVDEPAQDGMPSDHDGHAESDVEDESPQDREETLDHEEPEAQVAPTPPPTVTTEHHVVLDGEYWHIPLKEHYNELEAAFVGDLCSLFAASPASFQNVVLLQGSLRATFAYTHDESFPSSAIDSTLGDYDFPQTRGWHPKSSSPIRAPSVEEMERSDVDRSHSPTLPFKPASHSCSSRGSLADTQQHRSPTPSTSARTHSPQESSPIRSPHEKTEAEEEESSTSPLRVVSPRGTANKTDDTLHSMPSPLTPATKASDPLYDSDLRDFADGLFSELVGELDQPVQLYDALPEAIPPPPPPPAHEPPPDLAAEEEKAPTQVHLEKMPPAQELHQSGEYSSQVGVQEENRVTRDPAMNNTTSPSSAFSSKRSSPTAVAARRTRPKSVSLIEVEEKNEETDENKLPIALDTKEDLKEEETKTEDEDEGVDEESSSDHDDLEKDRLPHVGEFMGYYYPNLSREEIVHLIGGGRVHRNLIHEAEEPSSMVDETTSNSIRSSPHPSLPKWEKSPSSRENHRGTNEMVETPTLPSVTDTQTNPSSALPSSRSPSSSAPRQRGPRPVSALRISVNQAGQLSTSQLRDRTNSTERNASSIHSGRGEELQRRISQQQKPWDAPNQASASASMMPSSDVPPSEKKPSLVPSPPQSTKKASFLDRDQKEQASEKKTSMTDNNNSMKSPQQRLSDYRSPSASTHEVKSILYKMPVRQQQAEDYWLLGECLCGQLVFRGVLPLVHGSFVCSCRICRRYNYNFEKRRKKEIKTSSGAESAERQGGSSRSRRENVDDQESDDDDDDDDENGMKNRFTGAAAGPLRRYNPVLGSTEDWGVEWLHLPGVKSVSEVLLASNSPRSEMRSLTSSALTGYTSPGTNTTVHFCSGCGMLFGAVHETVEGVIINRRILNQRSCKVLQHFENIK